MGVSAVLAVPVDVAPEPEPAELLEPPELQAAISVTAATAASAAVMAREGPRGATPGRLRNLMGNLLVALSGPAARAGAGRVRGARSTVCQENRSDVYVLSMGSNRAIVGRYQT